MRTTSLAATALAVLALACGGEPDASGSGAGLEETGTISADDAADPNGHPGPLRPGLKQGGEFSHRGIAEGRAVAFVGLR